MVWPTSPDAMACAGACRVPWTLRRPDAALRSAGSAVAGLAGGDDGLGEVGLTFQLVSMGTVGPVLRIAWVIYAGVDGAGRLAGCDADRWVCSLPAECAKVGQIPGPGPPQGLLDGQVLTLCDQLLGGKDAERAAILAVQLNLLAVAATPRSRRSRSGALRSSTPVDGIN